MGEPIKMLVGKNALEELLKSDPKVFVELESMACEKIAEEITRKVTADTGKVAAQGKAVIDKAIGSIMEQYGSRYRFPEEAKAQITLAVKAAIDTHYASMKDHFLGDIRQEFRRVMTDRTNEAVKVLNDTTQKAMDHFMAGLADRVEKQARATFIDVIREAKGVTG